MPAVQLIKGKVALKTTSITTHPSPTGTAGQPLAELTRNGASIAGPDPVWAGGGQARLFPSLLANLNDPGTPATHKPHDPGYDHNHNHNHNHNHDHDQDITSRLLAGASPWELAHAMASGPADQGLEDNAALRLADAFYRVFLRHGLLTPAEIITHSCQVESLLEQLQKQLGSNPETWGNALSTLANPYQLSFGNGDLQLANSLLDLRRTSRPEDFHLVNNIFAGVYQREADEDADYDYGKSVTN